MTLLTPNLSGALCAGHPEPLWDNWLVGESPAQRDDRHAVAIAYCRRCPALEACAQAADPAWDEGVWAGRVLGRVVRRQTWHRRWTA